MTHSPRFLITSLTKDHEQAIREIGQQPEFVGDFGMFLGTDECRQALAHEASLVACDESGGVIGFILTSPWPLIDGEWQVLLRMAVVSGWQRGGVGSALLHEATERVRRGPVTVVVQALFGWFPCDALSGFAQRHGFEVCRHFRRMERPERGVPNSACPPGISVRAFDGSDAMFASWNQAYNSGFASHFRFRPSTETECREMAAAEGFDPGNVMLAFRNEDPVGFVRVSAGETGDPSIGWVEMLCVAPALRGQGLGRCLLRHGLARLQSFGCTRFRLTVDDDSPAAIALYTSEGFSEVKLRRIWERQCLGR